MSQELQYQIVKNWDGIRLQVNGVNWTGKQSFQVALAVNVRNEANTEPQTKVFGKIQLNELIACDVDNIQEANGHYWIHHTGGSHEGWSAIQNTGGQTVYLKPVSPKPETISLKDVINERQPSEKRRFRVVWTHLNVRDSAAGQFEADKTFSHDDVIEVDADSRIVAELNGIEYIWWKHDRGWSAERRSDNKTVYLEEIVEKIVDKPAPVKPDPEPKSLPDIVDPTPIVKKRFRVLGTLTIREGAGGEPVDKKFYKNDEVEVDAESRTVANLDGIEYVWWKHDRGWSAERRSDNKIVYLEEIVEKIIDKPAPVKPEPKSLPDIVDSTPTVKKHFRVLGAELNVRASAGGEPVDKKFYKNDEVEVDANSRTVAKLKGVDYIWWKHDYGWSAERNIQGTWTALKEIVAVNNVNKVPSQNKKAVPSIEFIPPEAKTLPSYRELFTQLPVKLNDTQWFQYFGNNMFAMRSGKDFNYNGYSQGLHGGLDFGNSSKPIPIYAGLEAKFRQITGEGNQTQIWLTVGNYTIIYLHIQVDQPLRFENGKPIKKGDTIYPNTQIAKTRGGSNGHLHLEVRYNTSQIVNPLWLMPESFYEQLTGKFNPLKPNTGYKNDFPKSKRNFFYHTDTWTKWVTPLDQPIIKLAGDVIGPRGELEQKIGE